MGVGNGGDGGSLTDVVDNSEPVYCGCEEPNGFRFLEYRSDSQVWIHMKCGGRVIKPLIKSEGK